MISPKGVSSRHLLQEFLDLRRHYRRVSRLWAGSYLASGVNGCGQERKLIRLVAW